MRALLFSGGIESTCLAAIHQPDLAITIDYGQKPAKGEVAAATEIASLLGIRHEVLSAPLGSFGRGELVGDKATKNDPVPEHWPLRNQMLATLVVMKHADDGLSELMIGTVASDAVHSDGTPEFIERLDALMKVQVPGIRIVAPAILTTTKALVKDSGLGKDVLGWCFSCHRGPVACGSCRGCNKTIELLGSI